MPSAAEEFLRAGRPDEALASLRDAVRANPAEVGLRRFLFQLLAVNGAWERALTQLQAIAQMEPEEGPVLARLFGALIQCEGLRAETFAGRKTPLIFGEPEPWIGWLLEANRQLTLGETAAAATLRARAFEAAPARAGTLNGAPFAWIADADSRMGPMLEVFIDGKYFWAPFDRIHRLEAPPPAELRDLVWLPAKILWTNGGQSAVFLPARYPGSETQPDGALRLARGTAWTERPDGFHVGTGQRLLATDAGDCPLLEVRELVLEEPAPGAALP